MSQILFIDASPRLARSVSSSLASEFLRLYGDSHAGDIVDRLQLWKTRLPDFDEMAINAKFKSAAGEPLTDAEAKAWDGVKKVFSKFAKADKYVFAVPMWNFGIPYKLKHYIDVIVQPRLAVAYSPETGFTGLLTGRKALIVAARGGVYSGMPGDPMDFQVKYLKTILGFIGISDVETVLAEGINAGKREEAVKAATLRLAEIAGNF